MDKISHIKTNMRITEWADVIRERNENGQTISEWCTNNGINLETYYYRQRKGREYICEHGMNDNYDIGSISAPRTTQHDIVPVGAIPDNDSQQIRITTANISVELLVSVQPQLLKAAIEGWKR